MKTTAHSFVQKLARILAIVLITTLCLTFAAYAASNSDYAPITSGMPYAKTGRTTSASGNAWIKGKSTNGVSAKFAILKYTDLYSYYGVYTSSPLITCETSCVNYGGLAYAGYIQPYYGTSGLTGYVYIYTS